VTSPDLLIKYLLIMGLRFDAMLYSSLDKKNSDPGNNKCSFGASGRIWSAGRRLFTPGLVRIQQIRRKLLASRTRKS